VPIHAWIVGLLVWSAAARADDWSLTRPSPPPSRVRSKGAEPRAEPGAEPGVSRERILRLLLSDPTRAFALERLLSLYRERDGGLDGLAAELAERSAQQTQSYALWLLRGEVDAARANRDGARAAFARAAELAPAAAAPLAAEAELERAAGGLDRAAALFEQALQRTRAARDRAELLRKLGELALERQDFARAQAHYAQLVSETKGGLFERGEYPRALAARGHHPLAVAAYHKVIDALRGDDRVLPPLLLELARAQLETSDGEGALASLARARKLAPAGTGVRHELDEALLETERRLGRLPELAAQLQAEPGSGLAQSELLGRIYEELGDPVRALAALRRALAREPRRVDLRERAIGILLQQGELGQAIAEYRGLLQAAPREPRYVVELAKLLMESGRRQEALALLAQTASRASRDARVLRSVFELYSRWGEQARATAVLTTLTRLEPEDPSHLIALGEQLLERGDQAGALALWRKLLELMPDKTRAHATLAGAYLDHDMPERALAEYEAAAKADPSDLELVRGLAETLEKLQRNKDAAERWQQVLALSRDLAQRREARRRVVRLWAGSGQLEQRATELAHAFGWPPREAPAVVAEPELEAGRFLAECYRALGSGRRRAAADARYLELSERVLARVLVLAPGDVESMLSLERLRAVRGNLAGAIEVLSRLVLADPKNARGYLARMAEHALASYRDDEAIGYAERLVALDPNDAKAHERLGDLYRARQSTERAIASYERAIALDENAFVVSLELAELYSSRSQTDKADALLRKLVRACPDDELVKRAARWLIAQDLGTPGLRALEQVLSPLALGNSQRPVYRALLVELYDAMTQPLLVNARGAGPAAEQARAELRAIGERAIKPLLEALVDGDPGQRRIAIDVLGQLHDARAASALLAAAEREGETPLRRRALLAAGMAAPPELGARFAVLAQAPERRLRDAATWALARIAGPSMLPRLRALLASNTPAVRAQALLGLGRKRDGASIEALREALRADASNYVRGAAALALGSSGDRASVGLLTTALRTEQGQTAAAVALAAGLLGDRAAVEPLGEALFASDPMLRRAALWALRRIAVGPGVQSATQAETPEPDEHLSLQPLITSWLGLEPAAPVSQVLQVFAPELRSAAEATLQGPPGGARIALALLSGADPLLRPQAAQPDAAFNTLIVSLSPALSALGAHPDPGVRAAALGLLASVGSAQTDASLTAALDDGDEQVQSAALARIGAEQRDGPTIERVAAIAARDPRWWMRLRAVQALGRSGAERAALHLGSVLAHDSYAYVREAAADALRGGRSRQAVPPLAQALSSDLEPRVREAAARALRVIGGTAAQQALDHMDAATRAALAKEVPSKRN
jgi:tetratricopeptide (TPR) repeat protein